MGDQPHWLKAFILRFSVLIAAKLDDSKGPASDMRTDGSSMHAKEQQPPAEQQNGSGHRQQIAKGERASAERGPQAADWLPPSLLPPKPDGGAAGGKQKQPKQKRAKQQRSGTAQAGGVQTLQSTSSSTGSWEIAAAHQKEAHRSSNGCMSDSSVDMSPAAACNAAAAQQYSRGQAKEHAGSALLANGHTDKALSSVGKEAQEAAQGGFTSPVHATCTAYEKAGH